MSLIKVEQVGKNIGVTFSNTTIPPDTTVKDYIVRNERRLLADITELHKDEKVNGFAPSYVSISNQFGETDGVNKTFFVKNLWVADKDFDGQFDKEDIVVNIYDEVNDTWADDVPITSYDGKRGKIVLTDAPARDSSVFITYRKYLSSHRPDLYLLEKACYALVARDIWNNANSDLINKLIDSYSVDGLNVNKGKSALVRDIKKELGDEYQRLLRLMNQGDCVAYE